MVLRQKSAISVSFFLSQIEEGKNVRVSSI